MLCSWISPGLGLELLSLSGMRLLQALKALLPQSLALAPTHISHYYYYYFVMNYSFSLSIKGHVIASPLALSSNSPSKNAMKNSNKLDSLNRWISGPGGTSTWRWAERHQKTKWIDSMFQHNWGARLTKIKSESESSMVFEDLGCDLVLWRIGIVNKFLEFWMGLRRVLSTIVQKGKRRENKQWRKILCFVVCVCIVQWKRVKQKDEHQRTNYGAKSAFITEREWEGYQHSSQRETLRRMVIYIF